MGEVIDLEEWRRKKDEEAHQKELEEIRALRAEVAAYLDDMGGVELGPYVSEEERHGWSRRMWEVLRPALDGYSHWPIDSSDM